MSRGAIKDYSEVIYRGSFYEIDKVKLKMLEEVIFY